MAASLEVARMERSEIRGPTARTPHSATLHAGYDLYDLTSFLMVMPVRIGLGQHVAAAGLVRPVFPGAPSLGRIGTIAAIAGIDLALPEILDLAAQLLGMQQR